MIGDFSVDGGPLITYCEPCHDKVEEDGHVVDAVKGAGPTTSQGLPDAPKPKKLPAKKGASDGADGQVAADPDSPTPGTAETVAPQAGGALTFQHAGGGWYALSNGTKVKGKQAAIDAGAVPA